MLPLLAVAFLLAQASPSAVELPAVQLHGFVDVFYGLNTNRPADRTSFLPGTGTTARRANELNLRLTGPEDRAKSDFLVLLTVQTMNYLHSGRHRVAL